MNQTNITASKLVLRHPYAERVVIEPALRVEGFITSYDHYIVWGILAIMFIWLIYLTIRLHKRDRK